MESSTEIEVAIRRALPEDAKYLLEFTKADNWDYSWHDYQAAFAIDPEFLLVAVDASKTPVGFGGITRYSLNSMYIDTFIVRKDLRGKGIGRQIWTALLDRAETSRICLDGLPALVDWYKKQGFIYESVTIRCYCAVVTKELKHQLKSPYHLTDFSDSMWPELIEYDKQVYQDYNRKESLRTWFKGATVAVAFYEGNIVGYGTIHHKWDDEYGIRNVFADNNVIAETIIRHLCASLPVKAVVYFSVINHDPLPILKSNLKYCGICKRMYTKDGVKLKTDKIWVYAITKM